MKMLNSYENPRIPSKWCNTLLIKDESLQPKCSYAAKQSNWYEAQAVALASSAFTQNSLFADASVDTDITFSV